MMLCGKMVPCQSREALVTVTSYRGGSMDGYVRHPRLEGKAVKIHSLAQLVLMLDALLDMENCPGSPLPLVSPEKSGGVWRISGYRFCFGSIIPGRESWYGRTKIRKPCSEAFWS